MGVKLKRVEDQVIVITGGTSGIGLATAKRAAKRGARVVLCSRNEPELRETVTAIEQNGGTARSVVADVVVEADDEPGDAEDRDAPERALMQPCDAAICSGEHGRVARGENVDGPVRTPAAACVIELTRQIRGGRAFDRNHQRPEPRSLSNENGASAIARRCREPAPGEAPR